MAEATDGAEPRHNALVRAVVDFGGLAAWAAAFCYMMLVMKLPSQEALLQATWWLMGGSIVALVLGLIAERRVAPMPLFAGLVALVFGGLALVFQDTLWVKIKPTAINLTFAAACLIGTAMGKNPLKLLLGSAIRLSPPAWRRLTIRYGLFFVAMAVLNEVVWRTQPDSVWVVFRFPGLQILSVLFALTQVPMMMKDMRAVEAAAELEA